MNNRYGIYDDKVFVTTDEGITIRENSDSLEKLLIQQNLVETMENEIYEKENELIKTQIKKKLDKKDVKHYTLIGILIMLLPIVCDCILLGNVPFKFYFPFFAAGLFIEYIGINSSYFNYKVESLVENA